MKRRDVRNLFVSLATSLAIGEVLVRVLLPRPGFVPFPAADYDVLVPDSLRGYAYAPNLRRRITTADYDYEFATNSLGMRSAELDSGPPPRTRILVVGESYTQGLGVAVRDTWAHRLEEALDSSRVYNAGVSGYSLHQERLTARHFVPVIKPHLIMAGAYGPAYIRMNDPFVIVPGGASPLRRSEAVRVRVVPGGMLVPAFETPALRDITFWADRYWYFAGHVLHALSRVVSGPQAAAPVPALDSLRHALAPLLDELLLFQRDADNLGVPLTFVVINSQEPNGEFSPAQRRLTELIVAFAAEHHLCAVNTLPALTAAAAGQPVLRFKGERHWNARAHEVAAETIVRELRAAGARTPCGRAGAVLRGQHGS
jgi:hypothetical protein